MPIQEDRHFFAFNIILIKDIWTNDNHIDLSVRPFSWLDMKDKRRQQNLY
ncbi:hypothetical protein PD502_13710 [Staphylococcus aureus]